MGDGQPNGDSSLPAISADGRFVAFVSDASNLVARRWQRGSRRLSLRPRELETIRLVSRAADGSSANGESSRPGDSPATAVSWLFSRTRRTSSALKTAAEHARGHQSALGRFRLRRHDRQDRSESARTSSAAGWSRAPGRRSTAAGLVVAFSSRHPVDADDRADDFDLFVRSLLQRTSPW